MITENNHMKSKIKSPLLEIDEDLENINQMLDEESKQNSSVHN